MNRERDRVAVFAHVVKSVTADLSQIDRHLPIAGFDAAGTGHDQALKAHAAPGSVTFH
jgi:hypothetical protein